MNQRHQINQSLDLIDKWRKKENVMIGAFHEFFSVICPDEHPNPITEPNTLTAVLDVLDTVYPEHKEDWHYYCWELPSMSDPCQVTFNDKTYNAKNREEYVQFMIDCENYPLKCNCKVPEDSAFLSCEHKNLLKNPKI